jgi:hypothetical protein
MLLKFDVLFLCNGLQEVCGRKTGKITEKGV